MVFQFSDKFDGIGIICGIEDGAVVYLGFGEGETDSDVPEGELELWGRVRSELAEYFEGKRREFDIPIKYSGTDFQRLVWEGLRRIPYGQTRSYGELAEMIGRPGAARAVGGACNKNHICVIIPCHRVIGANRTLTGFGGGVEVKARLLEVEGKDFKKT